MPPTKRGTGAALSNTRRRTSSAPPALRPKSTKPTSSSSPTAAATEGTATRDDTEWGSGDDGVSHLNDAARGAESARRTIPGAGPCPARREFGDSWADTCPLWGARRTGGGGAGCAREGGEGRAHRGEDRGGRMNGAVRRAALVGNIVGRFTTWVAALVWVALWAATSFVRARAPMNTAGGTEGTVTRTTSASAVYAGRVLRGAGSGCSRYRGGPSRRYVGDRRRLGTGARLAVFVFAFAFALVPATSAPVLNADITTAVTREFFRITN